MRCCGPTCVNLVNHKGDTCSFSCYIEWLRAFSAVMDGDLTMLPDHATVPKSPREQSWWIQEVRDHA